MNEKLHLPTRDLTIRSCQVACENELRMNGEERRERIHTTPLVVDETSYTASLSAVMLSGSCRPSLAKRRELNLIKFPIALSERERARREHASTVVTDCSSRSHLEFHRTSVSDAKNGAFIFWRKLQKSLALLSCVFLVNKNRTNSKASRAGEI
jgi:hypothetical protein